MSLQHVFAANATNQRPDRLADAHECPSTCSALLVVDKSASIRFSSWSTEAGDEIKSLLCDETRLRLRAALGETVRTRIAELQTFGLDACVVLRDGSHTLRLARLDGTDETLFSLMLEADRDAGAVTRASARYQLTRRQSEVLVLVLGGASANDIARSLVISEYTAQGYVKGLLAKTNSRNRSAMVAKVLNWSAQPHGADEDRGVPVARARVAVSA